MTPEAKPLQVLLYGHPWVVDDLKTPDGPLGPLDRDLLVEVSKRSILGAALGEKGGPGPAGMLGGALSHLHDSPRLPAPLLLASRVSRPVPAVIGGTLVVPTLQGAHRAVTALIHVDEVTVFRSVVAQASRVGLYWDLADLPGKSLDSVGQVLVEEGAAHAWAGLRLYRHPSRPVADADERQAHWHAITNDYPSLGGPS